MIQKIGLLGLNTNKLSTFKAKKNHTDTIKQDYQLSNNNTKELKGLPYGYISFKGVENSSNFNFDETANAIIERAKIIAQNYNHAEITPYHILQSAIEEHEEKYAEFLNNPERIDAEPISSIHNLANSFAKKDLLENVNSQEYLIQEIEILKEENQKKLATLPKKEDNTNNKLELSNELIDGLQAMNFSYINGFMLLGTAFNSITNNGIEYPSEFLTSFQTLTMFKNFNDIKKDYLETYDKKAIDLWNKLALGSSLFVISKNEEDKARITASVVKTLSEPKHGNFNRENTCIFLIDEDANPESLITEISNLEASLPDKKLVFLIDLDKIIEKTQVVEKNTLKYKPELFNLAALGKNNTKLLLLQDSKSHYQFLLPDEIKSEFSNYINYYIPPVQSYEVNDILKKHKDFLKEVKKPFKKDARDKAIVIAEKLEGAYPDKAIDLMKRISEYYGDEVKIITSKEVEEFAYIAGDLFGKDKDETPIIYNTGKTLATYYGKETTRKDIENIVKQIKTGRIGTQGMIISSKDEEAGAGKKYTAEVIAGEAKVPFLELDTSDFAMSEYDVDTKVKITPADYMAKIFNDVKLAAKQNPYKTAIIYINNFEEFAFSGSYSLGYKQAKTQLAREMEKAISEDINILVLGSTAEDYVQYIPMAIKDFSQNIIVDSPANNKKSRKEVIENIIEKQGIPLAYRTKEQKSDLINKLVKITDSCSYVEIKTLISKASQIMIEHNKTKAGIGEFIESYLQLATGRTSNPEMPIYNKEATTSHECGHATNLEVMNNLYRSKGKPWYRSRDVDFITLDPRGSFLGAVFEGKADNMDYPFEAMFSDIVCAYGGHSCEKEFFDMDGSAGIAQDLALATSFAKRGVEQFGLGFHTGKISNVNKITSAKLQENIYKDVEVILTNGQIVSDLITETYKDFNIWFTQKYSKLIGSNNCMIDGDDFRKSLNTWIASQPKKIKEELMIVEDIILDIIKSTKNGKIYYHTKKLAK